MAEQIIVGDEGATFNEIVDEIFSSTVISSLCQDWTRLAMKLDHPHLAVQTMSQALVVGTKTHNVIFLELLTHWKNRKKTQATLGKLCVHFRAMEMNDIANQLLKRFRPGSSTPQDKEISAINQPKTESAVIITRREGPNSLGFQITFTEELSPKYVFDRVCLHLNSNVLNSNTRELLDAIVGEANIKLGLEQLDSVLDGSISVKQRWNNLKGLIESRQGLSPDSYEKFLGVLINLDHLNYANFSKGVRLLIQKVNKESNT